MQTIGPYSLNAFLKSKEQMEIMSNMHFITCNVQKQQVMMTSHDRQPMDVISHDSCSWKTVCRRAMQPIIPPTDRTVPEHTLPIMRITRRVRVKSHQAHAFTSNRCTWNVFMDSDNECVRTNAIVRFINYIMYEHSEFDIDCFLYDADKAKEMFDRLFADIQARCG